MKSIIKMSAVLWGLLLAPAVFAADCPPGAGQCFENPIGSNTFVDLLAKIVAQLTILAIPALAIIVIWGAFKVMTSGGNDEKLSSGKKIIFYGVIGFIILALGSGVGYIINNVLTGQ